jgi:hypothetical protein
VRPPLKDRAGLGGLWKPSVLENIVQPLAQLDAGRGNLLCGVVEAALDKAYADTPLPDGEYITDSFEVDVEDTTLEGNNNMDADDLEYLRVVRNARNEDLT